MALTSYDHTLCPALTPARETLASRAARLDRLPERFLDCLFIAFQSERGREGFAADLRWCAGLCRATWREEALWIGLVHVRRGKYQRTHLQHAAERGDVARVRWLLERGAPTELPDYAGMTACITASQEGHVKVVRALLAAGGRVDSARSCGSTALDYACKYGRTEVVRLLIASGADVNAINCLGETPLHFAATSGQARIIRMLLAAGALDVHRNSGGRTPREVFSRDYGFAWPP